MKKTILYIITQSELGGAQKYVFDLAKNLQNEFNISVAVGEQGEKGELINKLKQKNIKYYIIPHLKRAISPINDLLSLIEIIKLIKKIKPDIIHLNSSKISILGSIASIFSKSKIIYTAHGWVFNEPMPKWKKLFYKYSEKFTALFKNKIICVSEFDRQIAIKEKICSPKKLITIHNGIKQINFLSKQEARQKLFRNNQNSKLIIGTIANLYKTKGLEYLIQSIKILTSNFQFPIITIIIGEGKERKNLQNLINQLNLKNSIFLFGKINNASELLKAFDIYICSSIKEGLSYTLIEAMQAELPIVATNVGGNSELIENNKTGILIKPQNQQELTNAINYLIKNKALSNQLRVNAEQKAMNEFSLESMISKTKKIYKN